jgi:Leucine-rich repeat (LRR) protein
LLWIFLALKSAQVFSIKIDCELESDNFFGNGELYTCRAKNLEISENNVKISSIDGKHGDGKSNADVECFIISKQNVKFLPTGIKDFFPRLKEFLIESSQLEEIERKSFERMSTIQSVSLATNNITSLPEDTFYDLNELKNLLICCNKLKTLPVNLLMNQKKLEKFIMGKNEIGELPKGFFKNNLKLKDIVMNKNNLNDIDTADMFLMKNLKRVWLNNNKCIDNDFKEVNMANLREIKQKCSGKIDKKVKKGKGKASTKKINLLILIAVLLKTILGF